MLQTWTGTVIRHRALVVLVWFFIAIFGLLSTSNLESRLTTSVSVPGSESDKVDQILKTNFQENVEGSFTIFYPFRNATKAEIAHFELKIAEAVDIIPNSVINQRKALAGVLFVNVATPYDLSQASAFTKPLRESLKKNGMSKALVTGPAAIKWDVSPVLGKDLRNGEIAGLAIALLLLVLTLGMSPAVFLPLVFALTTIGSTLTALFIYSFKFQVMLYTPNIVQLIGLGLAIDYSLLIVHRFRSELHTAQIESQKLSGGEFVNTSALIQRTMNTAGRTIILSGVTVSIGLATLLMVPVPFVRSLGIAGILVPLISTLAALTLLPALLSFFGPTGVTSKWFSGLMHGRNPLQGPWAKIAQLSVHKPKTVFLTALVLLSIGSSALGFLKITPSAIMAIPKNLESAQALSLVTQKAGNGAITPHQLIVDLGASGIAQEPSVQSARTQLVNSLSKNAEVFVVASGVQNPYVDSSGRYLRLFIIGRHDLGAPQSQQLVTTIRKDFDKQTAFPVGSRIYLGGAPAQGVDLLHRISTSFPNIVVFVLLLVFLLLTRAFRSLVLPVKAILMDLLSVAVAVSALVATFNFGWGSTILGTYHLAQIEIWVLIFLFATLFGLSMDYEVFIVSRIRESWQVGGNNSDAVVEGLANTGGVVTTAALIFIGSLTGLITGHFAVLQQIGVGLAIGVFIDATVIRGLLLPSSMVLLGKWNWWLPRLK